MLVVAFLPLCCCFCVLTFPHEVPQSALTSRVVRDMVDSATSRNKRVKLFKSEPSVLPGVGVVFPLDTCRRDLSSFEHVPRPTNTQAAETVTTDRIHTTATATESPATGDDGHQPVSVAENDRDPDEDQPRILTPPPTASCPTPDSQRRAEPSVSIRECASPERSNLKSRRDTDQHDTSGTTSASPVSTSVNVRDVTTKPDLHQETPTSTPHGLCGEVEDAAHSVKIAPIPRSVSDSPIEVKKPEAKTGGCGSDRTTSRSADAVKVSKKPIQPTAADTGGCPDAPYNSTPTTSTANASGRNLPSPAPNHPAAVAVMSGGLASGGRARSTTDSNKHEIKPTAAAASRDQGSYAATCVGEEAGNVHARTHGERDQGRPNVPAPPVAVPAVSMVASFLKQPAASARSPSAVERRPSPVLSLPTTPTSLSTIVSGVPSSDSNGGRGYHTPTGGGRVGGRSSAIGARVPTPPGSVRKSPGAGGRGGGRSRFCNEEWPIRVKERRRILRFPSRSESPGTRILYWVRGSFRVRDNLALSVAMWLSRELRMPLQALAFVDPAVGRTTGLRAGSADEHGVKEQGASLVECGQTMAPLPFRIAVESSALCEMQHALGELNIPLTAISCTEEDIPTTLALWCGNCSAHAGTAPGHGTIATSTPAPPATTTPAMATPPVSPIDGKVHIAITDECYHPRQLWLAELAAKALPGVALYTVDSSSCCPVNTFHGGRATSASGRGTAASKEEYRHAQDGMLKTVRTELATLPRLPLESELQKAVFLDSVRGRAALPRGVAMACAGATAFTTVDWEVLQGLSARLFPGFARPLSLSEQSHPLTEDVIAVLGGGERAAEAALRQTLAMASASSVSEDSTNGDPEVTKSASRAGGDRQVSMESSAVLEKEISGVGFGGALLHLLRVGSISPLYVIQALLDCSKDSDECERGGVPRSSKARAKLLEAVLCREYVLYRSYFFYQAEGRACVSANGARDTPGVPRRNVWKVKDWQQLIPRWVMEELHKGQRDMRQNVHTPEEIKRAGSTNPSSVEDPLFSAIQVRLMTGGRLHPILGPYWARGIVGMMLIPSQAVALVIALAEDLCLGAAYAGDIVPELLGAAFDAFRPVMGLSSPAPCATGPRDSSGGGVTVSSLGGRATHPVFRALSVLPTSSREGLQSALGGDEALTKFVSPLFPPP